MAGTGWNNANFFVDNPDDRFGKNHIKADGFLKNVIRAGINKWFNDLSLYFDGVPISSYGYDYHQGYGGNFEPNIGILFGYGNGSFQPQITYSTGYDSYPQSLTIADFNNDNQTDIAVANFGTNNIFILYRYGNETKYPLGYRYLPYSIATKDLNKNGWIDIVIGCYGTDHIENFIKMCS